MHEELDPPSVKERLESGEGWVLVDVRTPEEFEAGHVAGAYHIPFAHRDPVQGMVPNAEFAAIVKKNFPADAKIVFC